MPAERQQWGTDEQFRLLIEGARDHAIFMIDPQGRVASWNPGAERMLGYTAEEILGQPVARVFTPEDVARHALEDELGRAAQQGRAEDERWQVRKDGSRFWAASVVTPLRDEHGTLRGFGKVLRDRTDLKELRETLQQRAHALAENDRRKHVFLAVLAHELRNPLTPVVTYLHIVRRLCGENPDVLEMLAKLDRSVQQLRRLVDDLLDFTRIGSGKLTLQKQQVELSDAVTRAVDATRPLMGARRHEVAVSLPPVPTWFEADPGRVQQVLVNLLNNAAKYTDEGGHVWVRGDVEGDQVLVRVRDDGIGIAAEMMPHIFDLFTQAEYSLERSQGGLGIGLALVRYLVQMHGGTVQAISEGVGKGSTFVVRLPGARPPSPPPG